MHRSISAGAMFLVGAVACASSPRLAHEDAAVQSGPTSPDRVASAAGFRPLRDARVPDGDIEVRIWQDYGKTMGGLVLRRTRGEWAAWSITNGQAKALRQQRGLAVVWRELEREGLPTLPDASTLLPPAPFAVLDGISYRVEVAASGRYRAYHYDNPDRMPWVEGIRLMRALRLLEDELGTSLTGTELTETDSVRADVPYGQVVVLRRGAAAGAFVIEQRPSGPWFRWVYRTSGEGPLTGSDVVHGEAAAPKETADPSTLRFGPFEIQWESAGDARIRLYYGNEERVPRLRIGVTEPRDLDKVDPATVTLRASPIDIEGEPWISSRGAVGKMQLSRLCDKKEYRSKLRVCQPR